MSVYKLDQRENEERDELVEQLIFIPLKEEDLEKMIQIGSQLSDLKWQQLINLLRANVNIFIWSATDMPGIPSEIITHQLNINRKVKPMKQKKRFFTLERQKVIDEKVNKLLMTSFIKEANYPDWLANVVVVRKINEQ